MMKTGIIRTKNDEKVVVEQEWVRKLGISKNYFKLRSGSNIHLRYNLDINIFISRSIDSIEDILPLWLVGF